MSEEPKDNVIKLRKRAKTGRPLDFKTTPCKHLDAYVYDKLPKLECKDCKELLDPYWYLRLITTKLGLIDQRMAMLRELEAKIETMKKDLRDGKPQGSG